MVKKSKAYVLDTWAVIAYLEDELSGEQVEDLIATAHEEQIPIYMSVINVGEVWYTVARQLSEEAARFKSYNKMSYTDAFAAALAKIRKAELVTGDAEFKPLDGDIKISWL